MTMANQSLIGLVGQADDKTEYARAIGYTGRRAVQVLDGKVISHRRLPWHDFCSAVRLRRQMREASQAVSAIRDAGFDARLQRRDRRVSIAVPVDQGDPRLCWDTAAVHVTPICAQLGARTAELTSPRGFEFSPSAQPGKLILACSAATPNDAAFFAWCFAHPQGDLVLGPHAFSVLARDALMAEPDEPANDLQAQGMRG